MAIEIPDTSAWNSHARGTSDGVSEAQKKNSAPTRPRGEKLRPNRGSHSVARAARLEIRGQIKEIEDKDADVSLRGLRGIFSRTIRD
jgi:hypothetical protein